MVGIIPTANFTVFVCESFPSQSVLRELLCFMQEVTINKEVLIHHCVTADLRHCHSSMNVHRFFTILLQP